MIKVRKLALSTATFCLVFAASIDSCFAMDSYRYLHVTIETPWTIFLFLLAAVLSPFVLMAVLVWRFAERKPEAEKQAALVEQLNK